MGQLESIYQEHLQLLKIRGFDDQTLGSLFRQDWLFEELKRNIGLALSEPYWTETPVGFTLKAVGGFNDMQDIVVYKLHYLFQPDQGSLTLNQLDVQWGIHKSRYRLKTSFDLPSAEQALAQLKREAGLKKAEGQAVRVVFPKKNHPRLGKRL